MFEQAKTYHAVDGAATVIGMQRYRGMELQLNEFSASVLNGGK
jgi:hypothetical protein